MGSRWYLQPEPLLQDTRFMASQAKLGHATPVYAYALNNPLHFVDENGLNAASPNAPKSPKLKCTECPGLSPKDSPATMTGGGGQFCFADQGDDKSNCKFSKSVRNNYCGAQGQKSLACDCATKLSRSICQEDFCSD